MRRIDVMRDALNNIDFEMYIQYTIKHYQDANKYLIEECNENASLILKRSFLWCDTTEGTKYWERIWFALNYQENKIKSYLFINY